MKKTSVFPWTDYEESQLRRLLGMHPEWSDRTVVNQFMYHCPQQKHTGKAIRSKINTLRPNKCKSKWNAIAHTRLAQMVINKNTYEDMAAEFNTSVAAISHQIGRIKNLGMIQQTPGRQVNPHSRVCLEVSQAAAKPLPLCIKPTEQVKQLNIDFNQRDANTKAVTEASIAAHNKLSSSIRAIDLSVENLMSRPRTATEMRTTLAEQEQMWGGTTQELILNQVVQVVDRLAQLMNNTLQLLNS